MLGPIANNSRGRAIKRQRISVEDDSDDEFGLDPATQQAMLEDGMLTNIGFDAMQSSAHQ